LQGAAESIDGRPKGDSRKREGRPKRLAKNRTGSGHLRKLVVPHQEKTKKRGLIGKNTIRGVIKGRQGREARDYDGKKALGTGMTI